MSSARAFLHDNRRRHNLHILPMTRVTKVIINSKTRTATGVEYVRNRLKYKVKARREVILSAGPIASPQLLMLSGVGPREHLSKHSIPVIHDLPVGRTLYDHITFPAAIFTLTATNVSINENRDGNLENVVRYLRYGDNMLSSPGAVEGIGYIKTPISEEGEGIPDIELLSIGGSLMSDGGSTGSKAVRKGMMLDDNIFNRIFGPIDNTDTWSALPMLLHPRSVGSLELEDNNPFKHPKMYGNYLTDPKDVATFVASIRYLQALAATEPFQRFGAQIYRAEYPTCQGLQFDSDEFWECAVRTYTATLHHQIATCRMGPKGDPLAVVDPELRVHGIRRLRVVDSSIIPRTVSAHTHAPAVMIGEKAADMIKSTWR